MRNPFVMVVALAVATAALGCGDAHGAKAAGAPFDPTLKPPAPAKPAPSTDPNVEHPAEHAADPERAAPPTH